MNHRYIHSYKRARAGHCYYCGNHTYALMDDFTPALDTDATVRMTFPDPVAVKTCEKCYLVIFEVNVRNPTKAKGSMTLQEKIHLLKSTN